VPARDHHQVVVLWQVRNSRLSEFPEQTVIEWQRSTEASQAGQYP
jgi:hypothetical protein